MMILFCFKGSAMVLQAYSRSGPSPSSRGDLSGEPAGSGTRRSIADLEGSQFSRVCRLPAEDSWVFVGGDGWSRSRISCQNHPMAFKTRYYHHIMSLGRSGTVRDGWGCPLRGGDTHREVSLQIKGSGLRIRPAYHISKQKTPETAPIWRGQMASPANLSRLRTIW